MAEQSSCTTFIWRSMREGERLGYVVNVEKTLLWKSRSFYYGPRAAAPFQVARTPDIPPVGGAVSVTRRSRSTGWKLCRPGGGQSPGERPLEGGWATMPSLLVTWKTTPWIFTSAIAGRIHAFVVSLVARVSLSALHFQSCLATTNKYSQSCC